MKVAISYRGGVGDLLLAHLREGSAAGRVQALRREHPGAFVRLAIMPTVADAVGLFAGAPEVDELVYRPWDGSGSAFEGAACAGFFRMPEGLAWERPQIPLSPDEAEQAEALEAGEGFVVLHPFAGTDDRDWRGKLEAAAVARAIVAAGWRVVVLGGSTIRREGRGEVREVSRPELAAFEIPGVVNLVDRASLRLQAHLATRARRFVGAFSSFHCAALACGVPAYLVAPAALRAFFEGEHPVYGRLADRADSVIDYFGEERIAEEVAEWIA